MKEKLSKGLICTPYAKSDHQLADLYSLKGLVERLFAQAWSSWALWISLHQLLRGSVKVFVMLPKGNLYLIC